MALISQPIRRTHVSQWCVATVTCFVAIAGSAAASLAWPAVTALGLCLGVLPATMLTVGFLALSSGGATLPASGNDANGRAAIAPRDHTVPS